jgi:hypothetical protein
MHALHERCCGWDIHKKFVVACLLTTSPDGAVHKEVRAYSTMTTDLLTLVDWLREAVCGPVVMESTGSYWRPVFMRPRVRVDEVAAKSLYTTRIDTASGTATTSPEQKLTSAPSLSRPVARSQRSVEHRRQEQCQFTELITAWQCVLIAHGVPVPQPRRRAWPLELDLQAYCI